MKRIKALNVSDSVVTPDVVRKAVERGRVRSRVATHLFTLKCQLPTDQADPADYVDPLAAAGCTDATVGVGQRGRIALTFARRAMTFADAVSSAIDDVTRAIPGVQRTEVLKEGEP